MQLQRVRGTADRQDARATVLERQRHILPRRQQLRHKLVPQPHRIDGAGRVGGRRRVQGHHVRVAAVAAATTPAAAPTATHPAATPTADAVSRPTAAAAARAPPIAATPPTATTAAAAVTTLDDATRRATAAAHRARRPRRDRRHTPWGAQSTPAPDLPLPLPLGPPTPFGPPLGTEWCTGNRPGKQKRVVSPGRVVPWRGGEEGRQQEGGKGEKPKRAARKAGGSGRVCNAGQWRRNAGGWARPRGRGRKRTPTVHRDCHRPHGRTQIAARPRRAGRRVPPPASGTRAPRGCVGLRGTGLASRGFRERRLEERTRGLGSLL